MTATDVEICYLVQTLQVPTAEHYQSLVTALYEKDVVELCYLLGQGSISRGSLLMVGIPALCWHLRYFEIMILTHMCIKRPRTCDSPAWGQFDTFTLTSSSRP